MLKIRSVVHRALSSRTRLRASPPGVAASHAHCHTILKQSEGLRPEVVANAKAKIRGGVYGYDWAGWNDVLDKLLDDITKR